MSLIPTVYSSADAGAPALTGQAGSLVDLLYAVLVTGYGSGGGAKAGAGWTRTFVGTSKAVFRNNPTTGVGGYLRIDDGATVAGSNARFAYWHLYETMTDVDTGTGVTPTSAQRTNGGILLKSKSLDAVARAWVCIATETFFYLFVDVGNTATGWTGVASFPAFFGDLVTRKPGDNYHFIGLTPDVTAAYTGAATNYNGMLIGVAFAGTPGTSGYLLRDQAQTTASKSCGVACLSDGDTTRVLGSGGTYPDAVSGGLMIERIAIFEAARQIRGFLPNVYATPNGSPFSDMESRTDFAAVPAGTTILAKRISQGAATPNASSTYHGMLLFDISNEWGG